MGKPGKRGKSDGRCVLVVLAVKPLETHPEVEIKHFHFSK